VEPASFYLKNLSVNLNILLPLSLLLPLALPLLPFGARGRLDTAAFASPAFLWLAVMLTRAHKEERFLFPTYPLLILAGALSTYAAGSALRRSSASSGFIGLLGRALGPAVVTAHAALSISRAVAMRTHYGAPLALAGWLARGELSSLPPPSTSTARPARLCVGAEWHRYASSFFLPHAGVELAYVRTGFGGQLPQPFRANNGTWAPPLLPFNTLNEEEPSRYVPLATCRYLVELLGPPEGASEMAVRSRVAALGDPRPEAWVVLKGLPFLDVASAPALFRAFWVPVVGRTRLRYGQYVVLKREEG
jgi:alpha-1,2-mannosyltransferase